MKTGNSENAYVACSRLSASRRKSPLRRFVMVSVVLTVLAAGTGNTATWTVNNNESTVADYRTLQAANDDEAVVDGDIVLVSGSQIPYPGATLTKSLTVYGPGYFLPENQPAVNTLASATIGALTLSSTPGGGFDPPSSSTGSVIMGLVIPIINVVTTNITVQRCYVDGGILVADNSHNSTVLQSYVTSIEHGYGQGIQSVNNLLVANCFCGHIRIGESVNGAVIQNNIVQTQLYIGTPNSTVSNNILLFSNPGSFYAVGIFQHNMLAAAAAFLPAGNGNVNSVNPVTVFVESGTTDGQWQLKTGSVAAGIGVNGEDLGMFGGATPYVLSGLPPIPSVVIDANATGTGLTGLKVHIEAHARN